MSITKAFSTEKEYTIESVAARLQKLDTSGRVYYVIEGIMIVAESIDDLRADIGDSKLLLPPDEQLNTYSKNEALECMYKDKETGRDLEIWLHVSIARILAQ